MPWALQPMSSYMCARAGACAAVLRSTGRDWRAAKGFGATVTCTGFQLALNTPWPSHVVSTRSQAALWAQVAVGSQSQVLGMAAIHGLWTTLWPGSSSLPLPVLQSPTLRCTQRCWTSRAKSQADAGGGADAAGARPW